MNTSRNLLFASALALGLVAAACGDDDGVDGVTPPMDVVGADTVAPVDDTVAPVDDTEQPFSPDTAPPAPNTLAFAPSMFGADGLACTTHCTLELVAGEERELAIIYRDANGVPRVDAAIRWAIDAPAELARLNALTSYTEADGVARVTLRTFDLPGSVTVTASASGDDGAGELDFVAFLELPPAPVLLASHEYVGAQGFSSFTLRLFRQNAGGQPSCGAVHPDAGGVPPTPDVELGPFGAGQQAQVMDLPGLDAAGEQAWTVQFVGPASDGAIRAVGCEGGVVVRSDATATALVYVLDLAPRFRGEYRSETRLDLVTGASGPIGTAVNALVDLFTQPGALVLRWACQNASGNLGTVCGYLVNSSGAPTLLGGVIVDAANVAFLQLISSALGDNVTITGQTVSEVLRDLRLLSDLVLGAEPAASKPGFDGALFAPGLATESWTYARFRWKHDASCKNAPDPLLCGWGDIPLETVYGFRPGGALEAGVDMDFDLHITRHRVDGLSYGPLVNAIVERYLLPLMFGDGSNGLPPVDSWDKLVATLFGDPYCLYYDDCCEYFAYRLEDDVPIWVSPFLPAACEAAIPLAANVVRNQLLNLDGEMHVGTPIGEGCRSYDGDADRWVDAWGTAANRCAWDLYFPTGSGDFSPDTDWRAVRQ